jgi:uncharacterized membrane protein YhaH (DUF805 family)
MLFGTSGRIGRARFWLGVMILLAATIVVFAILAGLGLRQVHAVTTTVTTVTDNAPGVPSTSHGCSIALTPWGNVLLTVLLAYPWAALGIRRRHDRANPGCDVIAVIALAVLASLFTALGQGSTLSVAILGLFDFLGSLWPFVVLGCLRGTLGPNEYGPDPTASRP